MNFELILIFTTQICIAFEAEVEAVKAKIAKSPNDFALEGRKPSDFQSSEYFEEDSRRGKG